MPARLLFVASAILSLSACVAMPIAPMGAGGTAPTAVSAGPTAANLPRPGSAMTPENCAAYRQTATAAGMMTPSLEASLAQQGC